ncbi:MAG: DUF6249 domain-containing protein [Marinoscillum sp.]|uniref:DUF6249 domain-containing protein n=1 Tax=Marinoscillum sp. TaxID=2024838 RepID=UPI0032F99C80
MDHHLESVLMPIAILGTLSVGIVLIIKTLTEYFLRKKMVEKGLVGNDAGELLRKQAENKYAALKWGLIILFGGLGLMIIEAIPYDASSTLPYGVLATSLSLGFLIYFGLVQKMNRDEN